MFGIDLKLVLVALGVFVGLCVAGWFLGKKLAKVDDTIEDRRRIAGKLAQVHAEYGLETVSDFLIAYSIGDYSGMAIIIRDRVRGWKDNPEATIRAEMERVADIVNERRRIEQQKRTPGGPVEVRS